MRRILGAAALIAVVAGGCTDTPKQEEETPSAESSAEPGSSERVEGAGLCNDMVAEPLQVLAASYGFSVEAEDGTGPRCHGYLEFVENEEPVIGVNGMTVTVSADRFATEADAEAAFASQSDPDNADFKLTLSSGRIPPENVDNSDWDGFRVVAADSDASNQELRALLLQGDVIVELWVEIDPIRSDTEQCPLGGDGGSCAMTLDLADQWVTTGYADDLARVVAELDE